MTDEEKKKKEEEAAKAQQEALKAMPEQMKALTESLTVLSENQKGFMQGLTTMKESMEELRKKPDDKTKKQVDVNLETLDRQGFMDVIVEKITDALDAKVKPVEDRIQNVDDRGLKSDLNKQVKQAEKDHSDLWEWRDEMGQIAKRSPGLAVEEIYQLARIGDSDKSDKMDEKFKSDEVKKAEEKVKEDKAKEKEPVYGGLTPTSGKTVEVNDMTTEDAANKAFDDTFGPEAK